MNFFVRHANRLILATTIVLSLGAFAWFYFHGQQNLSNYDAIARLNIARKVIDSTAPGLGQLGGIWLPFPQVLMLPFIWSDFLWRSGIAGAIISTSAFVVGAYYLFKTVVLLTKSRLAGFVAWLAYASNINLLLLQSMAMSEAFFLMGIILVVYNLTKWVMDKQLLSLLAAGFFVTIVTLTRYEGYAVLLASLITVLAGAAYLKKKSDTRSKSEGIFVMFATLASLGIILWTLYSWLIYHDPIYWLHLYSGVKSVVDAPPGETIPDTSGSELLHNAKSDHPFGASVATYTWAMALMLGIPVAATGLIGFVWLLVSTAGQTIRRRLDLRFLPLTIVATIMLAFVVFGYWRGLIPPIEAPAAAWSTLMTQASNFASHTNIRYGLIMLPIAALLIGYMAAKHRLLAGLLSLVVAGQLALGMTGNLFLQFQLPKAESYSVPANVTWFKDHYDDGYILTSAQRHEPFMLQSGLPYKTFIYEGSRELWIETLEHPARHAKWIVIKPGDDGDSVDMFINRTELESEYTKLVDNDGLQIYKLTQNQ